MIARYVRVSTANQNYERQLVKENPKEKLFLDVCSGSILFAEREQGKQLLEALKSLKIDRIVVHAIDRLGRNLIDILNTLNIFEENGIAVRVDNLGIESMVNGKPNPAFKLIISVLANISEMERETMLERQREGIAVARAKGIYKGRVRGSKESGKDFLSKYPEVIKHLRKGQSLRNTAKLAEVSLGTVQKVQSIISTSQ
tara:strand:+ start:835 stop:1434 length:600 start_codon:yes stop_codon:yes gene_type:complete